MSYRTSMSAYQIDVKIPLQDIRWLIDKFYQVVFTNITDNTATVVLYLSWEEDSDGLKGRRKDGYIILCTEQNGDYKNSEDGGLSEILERYKGCGIIETTGESGDDHEIVKYTNGVVRKGKVVFD